LNGYCRKILKRKSLEESDSETDNFEVKKINRENKDESALVKTYKSLSIQEHIINIQVILYYNIKHKWKIFIN
jgi:hypothetical protein